MDDINTPPMHPKERETLEKAAKLVVTVKSHDEFRDDVLETIQALEHGDDTESTHQLSFANYDELLKTFTPRVLDLIEAIRHEEPASINEAARLVDRDVKNVHGELQELAQLGVIYFEDAGQAKQPVVWFDELVISLPFEQRAGDVSDAAA